MRQGGSREKGNDAPENGMFARFSWTAEGLPRPVMKGHLGLWEEERDDQERHRPPGRPLVCRLLWLLKYYTLLKLAGEGNGTPLQYSCLENPTDGGAWMAAVHGVAESRTQLSDFTLTFHFHVLEKEMATHSSVLACRIPGTEEPGGLPSMGSHRVGHD